MKKALAISAVAAGLIGLSGCAPYGAPVVGEESVNQVMRYETGTIRSVRYVAVQSSTDSAVGSLLGAATGAALGHMIGKGHGKELATIGGGLMGAYVGNQVTRANASELTIRTDRGRTIVVIVKGTGYYPGERVRIVKSGNRVASVEPI